MKRFNYICALILVFTNVNAQLLDSLREILKYKHSIDMRLESRYSFINNQLTSVSGFRLGLAFQRKLRVGAGVSWLKTDLRNRVFINTTNGETESIIRHFKFIYFCLYADFVFYKTKRWQLSVPIQTGIGYSWFQLRRSYYAGNKDPKYLLMLYEPGITVQFKVFKWLGLGSDVAYRFAYRKDKSVYNTLNSPTYSFKLLIWFDQLFYDMFPNSEISKKFGPSVW